LFTYIPLVVVVLLTVLIYIKIKKQRELIEKAEQYEKLLKESRVSRYKYQQILEKNRDIFKNIDKVKEGLRVLKAELESIRLDIRKHIESIRKEKKAEGKTDLDKRILSQMVATLGERWKFYNVRKLEYLKVIDQLDKMEKEKIEIEQAEHAASEKWTGEKETVLKIWRDLSTLIKITNPHKYYS